MEHPLCLISESCNPCNLAGEQHRITWLRIKGHAPWCRILFPVLQPNELASRRLYINPFEIMGAILLLASYCLKQAVAFKSFFDSGPMPNDADRSFNCFFQVEAAVQQRAGSWL